MAPAQVNQSILSGFEILQEVIAAGIPLGSREVARRLKMEHSRTNRILGTLRESGMLSQTSESKYVPGPGIHVLSALSLHASGLIPAALPVLESFHVNGATVALGTVWGDTVVYLLHANPTQDLAHSAGAHENYPRHKSIFASVLGPNTPPKAWVDNLTQGERSFALRLGDTTQMALAVVYPLDHPEAQDPDKVLAKLELGAYQIINRNR